MAAVLFDTMKYAKRLEAADIPAAQAQAQSDALREVLAEVAAAQAKAQQEAVTHAVETLDSQTEKALLKLDSKVELLEQRMSARFNLLQWMLGFLITGVVALLVRAFS